MAKNTNVLNIKSVIIIKSIKMIKLAFIFELSNQFLI